MSSASLTCPATHDRVSARRRPLRRLASGALAVCALVPGLALAGSGPAAAVEPTPGQSISLRSVNVPTRYIRHMNFEGRLTEAQDQQSRFDASFNVVRGLGNSYAVSLESVTHPGYFLRHENFALKLHPRSDSSLYKADATFWMRPGLAGQAGTYSLESLNYPGYYLRHGSSSMSLESVAKSTAAVAPDVTFTADPAAWKWDPFAAPAQTDPLIAASTSTTTTLRARWTDNDTAESGYLIAHGPYQDMLYKTATVGSTSGTGTARSFDLSGLENEKWYCFKVATLRSGVPAGWSATKCRYTAPYAPVDVVAAEHDTYATLTWRDRSNVDNGFRIQRSVNGGSYTDLARVDRGVTGYVDHAVEQQSSYRYRVFTLSTRGDSAPAYSNWVKVAPPATSGVVSLRLAATNSGTSYYGDLTDAELAAMDIPTDAKVTEIVQPGCGNTTNTSILLSHAGKGAWLAPATANPTWAGTLLSGTYTAAVNWDGTFPTACYLKVYWKTSV